MQLHIFTYEASDLNSENRINYLLDFNQYPGNGSANKSKISAVFADCLFNPFQEDVIFDSFFFRLILQRVIKVDDKNTQLIV